ncbi:MAG: hypothetical protein M3463_02410 [Verrucomicrobiota bacterium]|nr:hypothetical protein [Verrucomicrobiota bacterium]
MSARCLFTILVLACCARGFAHEFPGHAAHEHGLTAIIGSELYVGKRGYWHGGAGVSMPLGNKLSLELGAHLVREETGAAEVPSFEAELIREFEGGWELEAFGFGYPKVEGKQAWGVGLRVTKQFALQNGIAVSPFFGPAYAQVRASDEAAEEMVAVQHTLALGGVTLEAGPVAVTFIGSHSFYDRDPSGLETPVDFESMSHFAAYENNDGFPQKTFAIEIACEVTEWLTLHARYAVLQFDNETRHAIAFTPAVRLGERVEITGGVQLLRGGEVENDLVFGGLSVSF